MLSREAMNFVKVMNESYLDISNGPQLCILLQVKRLCLIAVYLTKKRRVLKCQPEC